VKAKAQFFNGNQFVIQFTCDSELYHSMMAILSWTNKKLDESTQLTGDEILNMAIEDFTETYMGQLPKLLKRVGAAD
jgi:hypothetical protein